jgi:flagella basal body P-ring formation protein FlgA
MRAVRAIQAGAVLRKDQFRPEPILRKGQKVEIVLEAENLRIVAPGQSLEDGGKGESIRVLNTSSRQVIVARVVDAKRVVVDF